MSSSKLINIAKKYSRVFGIIFDLKNLDVNSKSNIGNTMLICAVMNLDTNTVLHLLNFGANVNFSNECGFTALHFACINNSTYNKDDIFDILLNSNADINALTIHRCSCLILACNNGNDRLIEKLINDGAKINHADIFNYTPLMSYLFGPIKRKLDKTILETLITGSK